MHDGPIRGHCPRKSWPAQGHARDCLQVPVGQLDCISKEQQFILWANASGLFSRHPAGLKGCGPTWQSHVELCYALDGPVRNDCSK